MDFELNRYYDSNEANLGHATVEHVSELKRDTVWVSYTAADGSKRELIVNTALLKNHKNALKNLIGASYKKGDVQHQDVIKPEKGTQRTKIISNKSHNVYGIASGWRYDFPWIETVTLAEKEGWEPRPAYLHYGSAGVIPIETEQDGAGRRYPIQGLENYDYKDIKLEDWNKTVDGIACKYLLRDKPACAPTSTKTASLRCRKTPTATPSATPTPTAFTSAKSPTPSAGKSNSITAAKKTKKY